MKSFRVAYSLVRCRSATIALNLVRRGIEDTFHIGSPLDDRREHATRRRKSVQITGLKRQ
jgi:hypothetical protein